MEETTVLKRKTKAHYLNEEENQYLSDFIVKYKEKRSVKLLRGQAFSLLIKHGHESALNF